MSITANSQDLRIEGTFLKGRIPSNSGEHRDAEIDLNTTLANIDGHFQWTEPGTGEFSHSAENIHFSIEGADGVPVLRASLRTVNGEFRDADVNLAERISNQNGAFIYN